MLPTLPKCRLSFSQKKQTQTNNNYDHNIRNFSNKSIFANRISNFSPFLRFQHHAQFSTSPLFASQNGQQSKQPLSIFQNSLKLRNNQTNNTQVSHFSTTTTNEQHPVFTVDEYLKKARDRAKNKQFNPAIENYQKAADLLLQINDLEKANKLKFEIACANMDLFLREVDTQKNFGGKLKDHFYRAEALKTFKSFIESKFQNPDYYRLTQAHFLMGNLYAMFEEDFDLAKEHYEKSLDLSHHVPAGEMRWRALVPTINAYSSLVLNRGDQIVDKDKIINLIRVLVNETQAIRDQQTKFNILFPSLVTALEVTTKLVSKPDFEYFANLLLENSKNSLHTNYEALIRVSSSKLSFALKQQENGEFDDLDLGIDEARDAVEIAKQSNISELLCRSYLQLGEVYTHIAKHRAEAKELLNKALASATNFQENDHVILSIYFALARLHSFDEVIEDAVKYYEMALEKVDKRRFSTIAEIHSNIAQLYQRKNDPKFIEHLVLSSEYSSKSGVADKEWEVNLFLADYFLKNENYDKSLSTMISVLELVQNAMKLPSSKLHKEEVGPWPDICSGILEACTAKLYHPKLQKNFVKRVLVKLREIQEEYPTAFPKANDYCVVVIDRHIEKVEKMDTMWKS